MTVLSLQILLLDTLIFTGVASVAVLGLGHLMYIFTSDKIWFDKNIWPIQKFCLAALAITIVGFVITVYTL